MEDFARLFNFNWGKQLPPTNITVIKAENRDEIESKPVDLFVPAKPVVGNSNKGRSAAALERRKFVILTLSFLKISI